jgi:glycine cleavage system H protein
VTVFLVLLTFLVFLGLDWALRRFRAPEAQTESAMTTPATEPAAVAEPVFVAGYQLPEELHYPRGHTWARVVGNDTAVVGMDDFARRLTGRADRVAAPELGDWLEQGVAGVRIAANHREAGLVLPVGGEVVEVNPALREQPALATDDPYGRGWICKIRAPNLGTQLRNLMSGQLARRWTEDSREQLELRLMALSGSVLQDGGEPAADFADHLDAEAWQSLRATFLLS